MRILSSALRQRIFGPVRTEGTCTIWCGDPKDPFIFHGEKQELHEIAFHIFSQTSLVDEDVILPCPINEMCIAPNHLRLESKGYIIPIKWKRMMISLEDRGDIVNLHFAGVSKRTLKKWYMVTSDELREILETN